MNTIKQGLLSGVYATLLFVLTGMTSYAQETIEVTNIKAMMSKGTQPGYVVEIPQADLKTVQQSWIKKIQEGNKVKVKEINQELVLPGVVKSEFTKDTINFYSLLIQKENTISLNVFVEIDSSFFEPKEDKTDLASDKIDNSIKNYTRTFAVEQYRLAVSDELKGEQEALETLEKELEKLEKSEESMKKDNSSRENDIEAKEREINELDQQITQKQQDIMTHSTSMLTIISDTEKDAAKEKQKELEKEKKDLEKDRSKAKDDISSYKSKIEKNNKDIEESQKRQEEKAEEIIAQNEVIKGVQAKLDSIK